MTRFYARPEVVACTLNGGAALLDLESSKYFALNATGTVAWERLQAGATLDELIEGIETRFEVTRERCARDTAALLEAMLAANIVRAGAGDD